MDHITLLSKLAKRRGGKLLSKQYINHSTKLKWECSKGHQWQATPTSIKNNGTWCPYCSGRMVDQEARTKEFRQIAKQRGGKLLSKQYINSSTKLEWQCSQGHQWQANPASIKSRGTWCPHCARKRT